jgi:hypothetical protein
VKNWPKAVWVKAVEILNEHVLLVRDLYSANLIFEISETRFFLLKRKGRMRDFWMG